MSFIFTNPYFDFEDLAIPSSQQPQPRHTQQAFPFYLGPGQHHFGPSSNPTPAPRQVAHPPQPHVRFVSPSVASAPPARANSITTTTDLDTEEAQLLARLASIRSQRATEEAVITQRQQIIAEAARQRQAQVNAARAQQAQELQAALQAERQYRLLQQRAEAEKERARALEQQRARQLEVRRQELIKREVERKRAEIIARVQIERRREEQARQAAQQAQARAQAQAVARAHAQVQAERQARDRSIASQLQAQIQQQALQRQQQQQISEQRLSQIACFQKQARAHLEAQAGEDRRRHSVAAAREEERRRKMMEEQEAFMRAMFGPRPEQPEVAAAPARAAPATAPAQPTAQPNPLNFGGLDFASLINSFAAPHNETHDHPSSTPPAQPSTTPNPLNIGGIDIASILNPFLGPHVQISREGENGFGVKVDLKGRAPEEKKQQEVKKEDIKGKGKAPAEREPAKASTSAQAQQTSAPSADNDYEYALAMQYGVDGLLDDLTGSFADAFGFEEEEVKKEKKMESTPTPAPAGAAEVSAVAGPSQGPSSAPVQPQAANQDVLGEDIPSSAADLQATQAQETLEAIQNKYRSHHARVRRLEKLDNLNNKLNKLEKGFTFPETLDFVAESRESSVPSSPHLDPVDSASSSSESLHVPALAFTPTNTPYHAHAQALLGLLVDADAISSDGEDDVRTARKEFVKRVEKALGDMEVGRRGVWEKQQTESVAAAEDNHDAKVEEKPVIEQVVSEAATGYAIEEEFVEDVKVNDSAPAPADTSVTSVEEASRSETTSPADEAVPAPAKDEASVPVELVGESVTVIRGAEPSTTPASYADIAQSSASKEDVEAALATNSASTEEKRANNEEDTDAESTRSFSDSEDAGDVKEGKKEVDEFVML